MSALLLTLPLGKYFGFDEIWDDATAVEGLRQVGEAGQACYWIHHKVAAPLRIAAPDERTSTEQPSESSRFDDDADDDGTQSRPSCSFGRRPSTEPRSSTKMYPNLTPCAATSPVASVGYPCASGARHTEAYCSSLSWNGTKPGPAAGTTAVERGGERGRSSISR